MSDLTDRVKQALDDLGDTPKQVAAKLAELGITGVPGINPGAVCPTEAYLASLGLNVKVHGFSVMVYPDEHRNWDRAETVHLPRPVTIFLRYFDMFPQDFPELLPGRPS
jgi:hypothetical protein